MQKITIHNFGPIKAVEALEISNTLLLIGQQASGKSTISKLIYFFKSLKDDVFACLEEHQYKNNIDNIAIQDTQLKLFAKIKSKFYTFFGSTKYDTFALIYEYQTDLTISLRPNEVGSIVIDFSNNWYQRGFYALIKSWNQFLQAENAFNLLQKTSRKNQETSTDALLRRRKEHEFNHAKEGVDAQINALFGENEHHARRLFYIPAGRSLLSSLKQSFQSRLIDELINAKILDEIQLADKTLQERKSYFEFFVRDFFERIDTIKNKILFGKTLTEVIEEYTLLQNQDDIIAKAFHQRMKKILKADYKVDAYGERLVSSDFTKPIKLDFASSGQQEVIWILLQLLVLILENQPSFVVIEEPEAHLYPTAQVEMLQLIALFLQANPHNQVIITTHSPYMLTAMNNLLFAQRVYDKNPANKAEIIKAIGTESWISPNAFGAYYIANTHIVNIFNKDTGVIAESELDDASESIMEVFDSLMDIYKV